MAETIRVGGTDLALAEITLAVEEIRPMLFPLLAGRSQQVQGAILADLTAIWIAGHFAGSRTATLGLRAKLVSVQRDAIRQLVPINAKLMGTEP